MAIIAVFVCVVAGAVALHEVVLVRDGFVGVPVEKREDDQG